MTEKRRTFTEWLATQAEVDDPVGDLARDVADDPSWPAPSTLEAARSHLGTLGACSDALDALGDAWGRYMASLRAEGLQPMPLAELMAQEWPAHEQELAEREYRRGYADGWIEAYNALWDAILEAGEPAEEALARAFEHWQWKLNKSWKDEPADRLVQPPRMNTSPAEAGQGARQAGPGHPG